jgi:hypothetical protein
MLLNASHYCTIVSVGYQNANVSSVLCKQYYNNYVQYVWSVKKNLILM